LPKEKEKKAITIVYLRGIISSPFPELKNSDFRLNFTTSLPRDFE
jgi:hypothetical protein